MPESSLADSYILFQLAGATYGVATQQVLQMEMIEQLTPVPHAPPYVDGVVFLRGQVIPAINLRTHFGFPPRPIDLRTRLVVLQVGQRRVGLIVDTAREFVRIPAEAILPPPDVIAGIDGTYLQGIASLSDRLVLILNAFALLSAPETAGLAQTVSEAAA